MEVRLGTYVTLTARDFRLDTGATGDQIMAQFGAVGARVTIGSLSLGGEGRNFAITGSGAFKTLPGFGVFLSVGSATGDAFKWPSFLPIHIDELGITWPDLQNNPTDFVLIASASVTEIKGIPGLTFSGSVRGIRIQPGLLAQGKFPIIGIDSLGVSVKGNLFGGEIEASLIGGILKLDSNYAIIGTFDNTTPVAQRVFYLGLEGGFKIAGRAGFTIRLGLSELGPLQVMINVELPAGVLLEPTTGLTINDFTAGVEFFKSLPSIEDPFALRSLLPATTTAVSPDAWLLSLQNQVAAQARTISQNPSMGGFLAAFTAPMTITGSARLYSIYTSQNVFNGQVTVKLSTDGKLVVMGKLNFANDNVSLSGRLYADLSKVATGNVVVMFLADIPDQVRLLSIYGKLKMGFRDASGNEVAFQVVDVPDPIATGTAPGVSVAGPAPTGGTVDVGVAAGQTYNFGSGNHHYVDITFTAPAGASLDVAALLAAGFTLSKNGGASASIAASTVPMIAVNVSFGTVFAPLTCTAGTGSTPGVCSYTYSDGGTNHTVTIDGATDLATAVRLTGTTRFRYDIGAAELPIGTVTLHFAAGVIKNADVTTASGTIAGAGNAATDLSFTVVGASGTIVDPHPGGQVDVNVLNGRPWLTWIDVAFTPPTGRTLNVASLIDGNPTFILTGAGVGTAAIDWAHTPIVLSTAGGVITIRYFITGAFADPTHVTATGIAGSWTFAGSTASGVSTVTLTGVPNPTPGVTATTISVTLTGVTLTANSVLDPASFVDVDPLLDGIQLVSAAGWVVTIDTSKPITMTGSTFTISVLVTTGKADQVFTPTLVAGGVAVTSTETTDYTAKAAVVPVAITGTPTSYIDIHFTASVGSLLNLASINGDEILLSGAGAAGVILLGGSPFLVGDNTYRYLLTGLFKPGAVNVTIQLNNFFDENPGRAPPVGQTLTLVQSFTVTGATADVVQTVTDPTTHQQYPVVIGGSTVGLDLINALHYFEIRFFGASGNEIDPDSINGGELQLRGPSGNLIQLGSPIRVGSSNLWRFPFVGTLTAGLYTLTFVGGSFADTAGILNLGTSVTVRLSSPTSTLTDPGSGSVLDLGDLNSRSYIDITFPTIGGRPIDVTTVLDHGAEFTITASDGTLITVDPHPVLLANGSYRYFFYGATTGSLTLNFIAGSWANTDGTVSPTTATPTQGTAQKAVWIDVTLKGLGGNAVDLADVLARGGAMLTLSGSGKGSLIFSDVFALGTPGPDGAITLRYLFTGSATAGTLDVAIAGGWKDVSGSSAAAGGGSFRLFTRGTSFYIELSGGIMLQAAGLTDEPILDLRAQVTLEIDPTHKVVKLTFDGQLSLIKLGTVGATSGRFILDMGDPSNPVPQFWGVATVETNFSKLKPYGLDVSAKGVLQINLTGQDRTETLTLKGLGNNGEDVTRTFNLAAGSFGIQMTGQLIVSIPTTGVELMRVSGGVYLMISDLPFKKRADGSWPTPNLVLFLTGQLSFGSGEARITYGSTTAVLFVKTDVLGGNFGVAGSVQVSAGGGIGIPDFGDIISATGTVTIMFNTTLHEQRFVVPAELLSLLGQGLSLIHI